MRCIGRSGVPLAEQWGPDDATAHLGITVPDFPNLFLLLGPNTALGHGGSMITIAELQVGYVAAWSGAWHGTGSGPSRSAATSPRRTTGAWTPRTPA